MFARLLRSPSFRSACFVGGVSTLAATSTSYAYADNSSNSNTTGPAAPISRRPGAKTKKGEPVFTRAQVAANDGMSGKPMWMTYRNGVYDVTEFHRIHPGGNLIMQAAGSDVSTFWDVWAYHHHAPKVGAYLEELRIGAVIKEEWEKEREETIEKKEKLQDDPYETEPVRDINVQTIFTERPYCSETPNEVLGSSYLTSSAALYVRNHAPVPDCAWAPGDGSESSRAAYLQQHEVVFDFVAPVEDDESSSESSSERSSEINSEITSESDSTFTVGQLRSRFGTTTITSILQCAGNRAAEDIAATGSSGFSGSPFEDITQGMVGNAQWSGVRLANVLPALYPKICASCKQHGGGEWHVIFEGADGYSASSPLARVLDEQSDCILATHMNGEPLNPDHGYPLRAVLPGLAGARNVKWLQSISIQKKPVDAPWNSYYYKNANAEQIQELPLQSLVLKTSLSSSGNTVAVSGVAYSGGTGNSIARVEVSTNNGETWTEAKIMNEEIEKDGSHKNFGWVRWNVTIDKGESGVKKEVCCRATDAEGKTQAEISPKQRGYLYNGWSKVALE